MLPAEEAQSTSRPARILVVDDSSPIRNALVRYFEGRGYEVSSAADGREAVGVLQSSLPDLVLLDLCMPGMDGLSVLRAIRRAGWDVSVLVLTANEDLDMACESLRLGARDYMIKPLSLWLVDKAVYWHVSARLGRPPIPGSGAVDAG